MIRARVDLQLPKLLTSADPDILISHGQAFVSKIVSFTPRLMRRQPIMKVAYASCKMPVTGTSSEDMVSDALFRTGTGAVGAAGNL